MKKIMGTIAGLAFMAVSVSPAFAATWVNFMDTGPLSRQVITINKGFTVNVPNNQTANVTNNLTIRSNTGKNLYLGNTKVLGTTNATGGSATANVVVDNQVNGSLTQVAGCPCGETNVTVDQTGPLSTNNVTINGDTNITVTNKQDAKIVNNITASSNSGKNKIIGNTKVDGMGSTGNSDLFVGVGNYVNRTETYINTTPPPPPGP